MAESGSLDKWRNYFRSANADIFDIIENAIAVAASDCPYDFKSKRDRIAEVLFACRITKCSGCDRLELAVPTCGGEGLEKSEDKFKSGIETGGSKDSNESKANEAMVMEMNLVNRVSDDDDDDDSFADVEALSDEIEEQYKFNEEVMRIKGILDNNEEESDATLFDSLRRLQLMPLSVETLQATGIGKSVNTLRKRRSNEIRNLVKTLVEDWKVLVDSWVNATKTIKDAEIQTECVKTSVVEDEEGLPSPPLEEAALFATPTSMELSQFFDGMDDDGNPRNCGEQNRNQRSGRSKPASVEKMDTRKLENVGPDKPLAPPKKNPEAPPKPNGPLRERWLDPVKPSNYESGPGRPKPAVRPNIQRKPMPAQQEKLNRGNESSVRMSLEVAKRKLQERYQEAENAKKQRTIQVVEFSDLPKQSVGNRNQQVRPGNGNQNKNWANRRR